MRIQTIVVGMDWSAAAMDAWREACLVARTFGAQVVLVHAIPETVAVPHERDEVVLRAQELLRDMALGDEALGSPPRVVVRPGRPTDVLLAVAREEKADLVVIGAGERTTLDRVLLGSAAEKVVREAPQPVWLARPGRAHHEVRRVLCALDGDLSSSMAAESEAALRAAVFLCRTFVADLTVATIVPDEPGLPWKPRAPRAERLAAGEAALREHLEGIDCHGVKTHLLVRAGKPAAGIVEAAAESKCDLLVMGTRGLSGLAQLWSGSTAERVIRAAPASTLVVRAG